jgi:hypothetical protein
MQHPTMDPRWGQDEAIFDYPSFRKKLDCDFYLKQAVPQDVHGQWGVIRSLVELSYYQYEFIDLAVHKAFVSFEMAMRLRHKAVEGTNWAENKTMNPLIKWFFKRAYFETDHEPYIDKMVWIRNHFSHPKMHSFGGPFTSHNLFAVLHLINDLYEDIGLRRERNQIYDQLQVLFKKINQDGGAIHFTDGSNASIYHLSTTFVNNKKTPLVIYLSFHQPFVIPEFKQGDSCRIYPANELDCTDVVISHDQITGRLDNSLTEFTICPISNPENQLAFSEWKDQYNRFAAATHHYFAIASPMYSRGASLLMELYKQE